MSSVEVEHAKYDSGEQLRKERRLGSLLEEESGCAFEMERAISHRCGCGRGEWYKMEIYWHLRGVKNS